MPSIHADRVSARIGKAREAFESGQTTDGKPFTFQQRKDMEQALVLTEDMRRDYLLAANWGLKAGLVDHSEFSRLQSAMSGVLDPETGWHVSLDLAAKVVVTKVCNELLEARGDA